ncbi:MAG: hypothetical protein BWY90_01586 [Deltaproteobacteria bacterium ADurb.BinA014]|nr:MAG: hypothetical protein BWY90_01586 [Deltaproteobacteria bacterium ADurb.BinA014]
MHPRMFNSPCVMPAAIIKVPASMRSGIIVPSVGLSEVTPSIFITSVPAPLIFAPMPFSTSARLTTSGSQAALRKMVVPCASVAAIITFSVPVTVEISK